MSQTVVTATPGRTLGTRPSRRLRAEGKLPGVVYGLGRDPITISVQYTELRDALKGPSGLNTVIQLDMAETGEEMVIVRSVQRDPIKRVVTHADFLRVDPSISIKVKVPIRMIGDSTNVTNEGGMIEQQMFDIEVEVSPLNIPAEIDADLSIMTIDRGISVADLDLPEGVVTAVPDVISVVAPVVPRAAKMAEDDELGELDEDGEPIGEASEGEAEDSAEASEDDGE